MDSGVPARIGPYEVLREIGRGGMGVVYLARDTKLDRDVAIKCLPDELAKDADRLARFEREAKTLAQLNHPNIAAIYGLEELGDARYLILEYVEGATLDERLNDGPLPLDEALIIAGQIAQAIEAAHERDIIHRDLKPANIKFASEDIVKVLDFGLAKAADPQPSSISNLAHSPTVVQGASPTMPGVIMGTAGYLSPEQARGRRVDKRADIFSFGCVLYEMLSGVPPFPGETATDSIGAILHKDVDLTRLPRRLPVSVHRLLSRCLERDRNRRLQAIGDARVELEDAVELVKTGEYEAVASTSTSNRARWIWPSVCGVLLVALAGLLVTADWRTAPDQTTPLPPQIVEVLQLTDLQDVQYSPALSPDGRLLAFNSRDGDDWDIFTMRVGGENLTNLTADSDAQDLDAAFSPDGDRIAFVSTREGGGVFVMGATGESPRRVSDEGFDPAWSPDGRFIVYSTEDSANAYSRNAPGQLWVVDVDTRERRQLDTQGGDSRQADRGDAVGPAWSPDGSRIAYWAAIDGQRDLFTISAQGGDRVALTNDPATDWDPIWSADGKHIYFVSDRTGQQNLWSIAIDPLTGEAAGAPQPVTPGAAFVAEAAISANGTRLAFTVQTSRSTIERVDFDAQAERPVGQPAVLYSSSNPFGSRAASADGEWIAFVTPPPSEDIYVMRRDGSSRRRLMDDTHKDRGPIWSRDGKMITFYSNRDGTYKIWQMNRDGTGLRPIAAATDGYVTTPRWSPDGRVLATNFSGESVMGMLFFELAEDGTLIAREAPVANFYVISWSPDGKRVIGGELTQTGTVATAIYDVETGSTQLVETPDGGSIFPSYSNTNSWMDANRYVSRDAMSDRHFIIDVTTGKARWLDEPVQGQAEFQLVKNATELFIFRDEVNTDIWMIELDTAKP